MLTINLLPYRLFKIFSDCQRNILKNCSGSTAPFKSINMSTDVASKSEGRNKLKHEKSPYLLQHQSNPVNWYPWGEEAFELAKAKEMPIFLSIGYSTCHWCHVMERESFENVEIANVMNKHFVNIKMDREERPDIDRIYMTFVQAVSGSGGWPMSVWMTPDLKPFYGGTYYPPEDQVFGRPGFKSLLLTIADQWKENREKFTASASKILEVLERTADLPTTDRAFHSGEVSKKCLQQLARSFEPAFGGFSDHPKFPQPVNINFLIYYSNSNPENADSIKMIDRTLKCIAMGGIHDHIGKGFCRYSTDKKWHVPHFEKMLYDNAQLTVAYINAFLLTKDIFFARIAEDVIEYVNRDMSHDEGGFYSAEDADSYPLEGAIQKVEGAFYVWSKSEIDNVLESKSVNASTKLAELFHWRYGVRDNGNVDPRQDPHNELKHKNVLYIGHSVEETAKHFLNVTIEEVRNSCAEAKSLLFDYRNKTRPRPGLDTKFIASWNGLMISAFTRAGVVLDKLEYTERGVKAMNFAKKHFISQTGDILRSCYREGDGNFSNITNRQLPIMGCVDDFCNLISASLDLFDATWNLDYLRLATQLQNKQDETFWDSEKGGYFNSRDGFYSIVRFKDDDDGAEPSSNSVSAVNLIRLFSITEKSEYQDKLRKLFQQFSDRLAKIPMSLPLMATAYDAYTMGTKLILILKKKDTNQETIRRIRKLLLPLGSTVISINVDECPNLAEWKAVIPCVADKIDDFSARDVEEIIYLRQGDKFTHVYSTAEFEIAGYIL